MAVVLVATPGAVNANSYETLVEANAYFEARTPLSPPWDPTATDLDNRALIMSTRTIDSAAVPHRRLVREKGQDPYYVVSRQWTGQPATTTQALAWPRIGMKDANGRDIPDDEIPQALKDAVSEYAGTLQKSDRTQESDASIQGLTSIRAGSVSLSFKDSIELRMLPDYVMALMPSSWFTDELIEPAGPRAIFEVL